MSLVNKVELAAIVGVSERTLTEWQREGLPFVRAERGASNHYDTAEVIKWMLAREAKARSPDQEGERDRLARLQGDMLELTIGEKRQTLIPSAEIEPAWSALVVAARQSLLAMPVRLAPIVIGMTDVDQVRELLDEQVNDALAKLAGVGGDAGASTGAVGATEEDPAVRVG